MGRKNRKNTVEAVLSNPVTFLETLTTIDRKPTRLYPKQKEYLLDPARFRITLKARQSGFSKVITGEALWASITHPLGKAEEILFVSVGERQAQRLLTKHFFDWYDGLRLKGKPDLRSRTKTQWIFDNGSLIVSLPNNPRTIRGYSPTRLYIDEFAHFPNSQEIITSLTPALAHGGYLTVQSTPAGKVGMFYDWWRNAVSGKKEWSGWGYHKVRWQDVPKWMETYHETVRWYKNILPKIAFRQEFECMFVEEGRSPFPMKLIVPCIDTENECIKEQLDPIRHISLGMDLARKHDKTVIIITEHMPLEPDKRKKGDLYPYKRVVRHVSCPDFNLFSKQLGWLDDVINRYRPHVINIDENGLGERIGEELIEKYGSARVRPIPFSNPNKYNMVLELMRLFQDEKILIPNNKRLIYQLNTLQREMTRTNKVRYKGEEDDYVWALAMAATDQRPKTPIVMIETNKGYEIFGVNEHNKK